MFNYEIPVMESSYSSREYYNSNKDRERSAAKARAEHTEFILNSRNYLLSEAMNYILQKSLDEETSREDRAYGKSLVEAFVRENGSAKLLREFSKKSLLTAGIANLVTETHNEIVSKCGDKDKPCLRISKTVNDEFFEKLIGLSDFKISEKINQRVCDSIEDYIQSNINDKLDLDELAEKTKEKIEGIKAKNSKERDKIVECYTRQYNQQVENIRSRKNRKMSVYEQLMIKSSKSIVADESIKESFLTESGSLDVSKIRDKVTVMYTFLEMLNTAKMAPVNEAYIEKIIKEM